MYLFKDLGLTSKVPFCMRLLITWVHIHLLDIKFFNVEKVCRFCLATRKDIQQHSVRSRTFTLRTQELFDEAANVVKTTYASCVDGLKSHCPSRRLLHFHPAKGFPPHFSA